MQAHVHRRSTLRPAREQRTGRGSGTESIGTQTAPCAAFPCARQGGSEGDAGEDRPTNHTSIALAAALSAHKGTRRAAPLSVPIRLSVPLPRPVRCSLAGRRIDLRVCDAPCKVGHSRCLEKSACRSYPVLPFNATNASPVFQLSRYEAFPCFQASGHPQPPIQASISRERQRTLPPIFSDGGSFPALSTRQRIITGRETETVGQRFRRQEQQWLRAPFRSDLAVL